MPSIRCAHCRDTHESVQEVRMCALKAGVAAERLFAPLETSSFGTLQARQEELRRTLEGPLFCGHFDKAGDLCEAPLELTAENDPTHEDRLINLEHDPVAVSHGQLERLRAGKVVDGTQLQRTQERRQQRVQEPVTEGYYKVGDTIYKVQRAVHGSGNLYAKELVLYNISFADPEFEKLPDFMKDGRTVHRGKWEYTPGAIRRIRGEHRLSMEECIEFGRLYGVCVRCGLTLTKEESIERGMGDICAGKGLVL